MSVLRRIQASGCHVGHALSSGILAARFYDG